MKNGRGIAGLFVANFVSSVAQGISMIAIPWYFAKIGRGNLFAVVFTLTTLVSLLWGPVAGALVDRYDRRDIFRVINVLCALVLGGVCMLADDMGSIPTWGVVLVFVVTSLNYNIYFPNLYAFMQEISLPKDYNRVTSYIEIQGQVGLVLSGSLAALLLEGAPTGSFSLLGMHIYLGQPLAAWSLQKIIGIDALTYLFALLVISFLQFERVSVRHPESGTFWERMSSGWAYLQVNRNVFLFGVTSFCAFVAVMLSAYTLDTTYVHNHLHASGDVFASSEVTYAFGAITVTFLLSRITARINTVKAIILMTASMALQFFMMASTQSVWLFWILLYHMGFANAGIRILRVTYLYRHIPNQLSGRAGGIFFISNIFFRLVFMTCFSMPFFYQSNHIIWAFVILGIFLSLTAGIMVWYYPAFPHDKTPNTSASQ